LPIWRRLPSAPLYLAILGLLYALIAGLKKVVDFDLGWQMATAKYIWHHHLIPSTDVFSYTAYGSRWIYPLLAGFFFLSAFKLGGYTAISWLADFACAGTTALCSFGNAVATAALTILAVPIFAEQTIPRSGMFTLPLFAAFARILFGYFRHGRGPLWLLPVLMVFWVNVHLGFIAGVALVGAYLLLEICEFPFPDRRGAALRRLQNARLWLLITAASTLVNPWGWKIWSAVYEQEFPSRTEMTFVQEFASVRPLVSFGEWRNPTNAVHWLIAIAAISALIGLFRKRLGEPILLLAGITACLGHARVSGPFAATVCILAGPLLAELRHGSRWTRKVEVLVIGMLSALVIVRCSDLLSNRFYLADGQLTVSGAGACWWLPQRATDFVLENHLPGEIFSTFNQSSYLVWKFYDRYRDFDDGRYIPFGDNLFYEQRRLAQTPLDAPLWRETAQQRNIRTVIYPLAPLQALGDIPLKQNCESRAWSAVYMDLKAVIFVRKDSLSPALQRLADRGCHNFDAISAATDGRAVSAAEHYQQLINLAGIHYQMGHIRDARAALVRAEQISDLDSNLYLQRAVIAASTGDLADAEQNFHLSLARASNEPAWHGLGIVYMNQKRYSDAIDAFKFSVRLADQEKYQRLYLLAKAFVIAGEPMEGLKLLDKAQKESPFPKEPVTEGVNFLADIYDARAAAYVQLGDFKNANIAQQAAVAETPENALRWRLLAQTYQALGLQKEAEAAQRRAAELDGK
jgi:tetratricopeptide (TPR) repeat protein